jgi:hypothetical protein
MMMFHKRASWLCVVILLLMPAALGAHIECLSWSDMYAPHLPCDMCQLEAQFGAGENLDMKGTRDLYVALVKYVDIVAYNESATYCENARRAFEYRSLVKQYARSRTKYGGLIQAILEVRDMMMSEDTFEDLFQKKADRVNEANRVPGLKKEDQVCQMIISSAKSPNPHISKLLGVPDR